jgi:hypothetical protein
MVQLLKPSLSDNTTHLPNIQLIWQERYTRWDGNRYSENYPCLDNLVQDRTTVGLCPPQSDSNPAQDPKQDPFPNPNIEWHSTQALFYNLKYSMDNGATWFTVTTPSVQCQIGVALANAPHVILPPTNSHIFTWNWDVSNLAVGQKQLRVEVYRQNIPLHYAFHQIPFFTNP